MKFPQKSDYNPAYQKYIDMVDNTDFFAQFDAATNDTITLFQSIDIDRWNYKYAADKWTIKEVLMHIIDTERIFAYRALCFARKDTTPLPGFDENSYADNSKASGRDWNEMLEEFKVVRQSTAILFKSFDSDQLETNGIASDKPVYVLGLGFIIVGHVNHHVAVIKERYL